MGGDVGLGVVEPRVGAVAHGVALGERILHLHADVLGAVDEDAGGVAAAGEFESGREHIRRGSPTGGA